MFLVDTNVISVELIRYRRDPQQAALLEQWLEQVLLDYGDRVLSLDGDAAQVWGRLRVPNPSMGSISRSPPLPCCMT